ncbi:FAD-dependent oxidoreductase [Streptomyces sp. ASQP_92]|uniref:FAD-dependent oxidoreductase n=1 Tax=Streptomyces sp. ASQP_92 TaxID=2979116 RepID=UPI0021BFC47C|nr:FAD-dependent oxidoreductase [Streptomyces sp. ASQP_92]MCT9093920.1 FAD-dependent oxidoreductase [Streptomyces sp. ASQP_92]
MSTPTFDADVLVVGAGPAGVAAALMATSLNMKVLVVEADSVGGKLQTIGALENVSGNWTTGPQLAEALAADLSRLEQAGRCSLVRSRAVGVKGHSDRAEVFLADAQVLTAQVAVVGTGVTAMTPADTDWISAAPSLAAPPLWRAKPEQVGPQTYVLGGDRPLGTWLRAHPQSSATLNVLAPPSDDYKLAEVSGDHRVRVVPVSRVVVSQVGPGADFIVTVEDRHGERSSYAATAVLSNLGNRPAALKGLAVDEGGYCPPDIQHRRIFIAGDLRSGRYQRIPTAQGSGAEAALSYYYSTALQRA